MRVVVQRVKNASVAINHEVFAQIDQGLLLLVGIDENDTTENLQKMAAKITKMRIFEDDDEKMNFSVQDIGGSILSVSQFTLLADTKKGNRPSFQQAMRPPKAKEFFDQFNHELEILGNQVKTGVFGADMQVELINDGPVTIVLDN